MPKKVIAKKMFGSNLLLAVRNLRLESTACEGVNLAEINKNPVPIEGEIAVSFDGKNPWEALLFARLLVKKNSLSLANKKSPADTGDLFVAPRGIEPLFPG